MTTATWFLLSFSIHAAAHTTCRLRWLRSVFVIFDIDLHLHIANTARAQEIIIITATTAAACVCVCAFYQIENVPTSGYNKHLSKTKSGIMNYSNKANFDGNRNRFGFVFNFVGSETGLIDFVYHTYHECGTRPLTWASSLMSQSHG